MVAAAKKRAKAKGLPCDLDDNLQIPEFCPILGIKLKVTHNGIPDDASPSIDRMVPELGYVKGNVYVISNRANRIKNNGTFQEHMKIADYIRRHTFGKAVA